MKNLTNPPLRQLFVLLAVLSPVGNSFAVIDKFDRYAYVRVVNDSNVFRVSGDQGARALLGSTGRNDTIEYFGAGFESDYEKRLRTFTQSVFQRKICGPKNRISEWWLSDPSELADVSRNGIFRCVVPGATAAGQGLDCRDSCSCVSKYAQHTARDACQVYRL